MQTDAPAAVAYESNTGAAGRVGLHVGDCKQLCRALAPGQVDLVLGSPPYEDARTYGVGFKLKGREYVEWAADRVMENLRVCRGLVAWVVEGRTKDFAYSGAPLLLAAEVHRRGGTLRKPIVYRRVGIAGSGGPDWVRNDWEPVLCFTNGGRLPWAEPTACGKPPKYPPGGRPSNRQPNGSRERQDYRPPAIANPGNVVEERYTVDEVFELLCPDEAGDIIRCTVGGGHLGSKLAHENEAPFPETLADFLIRSFCPPGGTVLDPFCGSGTTLAAAIKCGRNAIGFDLRESQIELTRRRIAEARQSLLEQVA